MQNKKIDGEKVQGAFDKVGDVVSDTPVLGVENIDDDAITTGIGRALGSLVGFAGAAGTATALAPAGLATAAGLGTAGILGILTATGEASERARAAGATREQRQTAASLNPFVNPAVLAGAIEIAPLGRFVDLGLLTRLTDGMLPTLKKKVLDTITRAGVSGTLEGSQEAASQLIQNLNEQQYNELRSAVDGLGEAAGYGGGAGAILSAIQDILYT